MFIFGFMKDANYDETSTAKSSNNVGIECECASEIDKL